MTNAVSVIRALLIYSVCIPLAIFLGYVLASPTDYSTFYSVGLIFGLLLLPLLLKYHHPVLVLTWNTTTVVFFLPGQPNIWMVMAIAAFTIAVLQYILSRQSVQSNIPLVTRPMVFLGLVVLATALLTGGFGFKALGSGTGGGKRYVAIFAAILGYYAISMLRVPLEKSRLYFSLYFLSGATVAIGSFAPYLPSSLYYIFLLFPVDSAFFYDSNPDQNDLSVARLSGLAVGAVYILYYLLGRYGIRGMIQTGRPWRFGFYLFVWVISMMGGYRSMMLATACLFVVQFWLEGLHKTSLLPLFLVVGLAMTAISLPFAAQLPYALQRALSVFRIPVSPEVELDTRNSNEWRIRMWADVAPQIPRYLLLGKGFGINMRETIMAQDMVYSRRSIDNTAAAQASQDYHNGPLSVLIPLGIFGVIGLVWFWYAGLKLLYANHRYGVPELQNINTLLLSLFITKIFHFVFIFGSLHIDFYQFTGLLGLSVALNGGMGGQPAPAVIEKPVKPRGKPAIVPQAPPLYGR